jgi:capsular polysaccharide biosynthesis protein
MQEINLYELLKHYAKYWGLILVLTLAGLISAIIYNNVIQKPLYKSNATLILISDGAPNPIADTTTINNYLDLLKSRRVLEPVITNLKLPITYEQLSGSVSTSNDKDTEVLMMSITNSNPQTSKDEVNSTIDSFRAQVKNLYGLDNVKVVDSASIASTPYNVHKILQLILFTAAGFITSVIIIFFIFDFRLNKTKTSTTAGAKNIQKRKPARKKTAPSRLAATKPIIAVSGINSRFAKKKSNKTSSKVVNSKKTTKKK